MELTVEFIFAVVTAAVTALAGTFFKNNIVPARFIPLQNLVIGIVAAVVAISLGLFDNIGVAILVSLGMSLGVGGAYDATQTKSKSNKYK